MAGVAVVGLGASWGLGLFELDRGGSHSAKPTPVVEETPPPAPPPPAPAPVQRAVPPPTVPTVPLIPAKPPRPDPATRKPEEVQAEIKEQTDRAREQISQTLNGAAADTLEHCWPNRPPGNTPPIGMGYSITFDRNGNETSRAVRPQELAGAPAEVIDCLRHTKVPPFHVEPSDNYINVDVKVAYP